MPAWFQVAISLGVFCAFPFAFMSPAHPPVYVASGLLASTVLLSWRGVSSRRLGYFEGLRILAEAYTSFDDTLTTLYLPFVIIGLHVASLGILAASPLTGRAVAQERWARIVKALFDHHYGARPEMNFDAVVAARRGEVALLLRPPASRRPWLQRTFLLYAPRDRATAFIHAGFFIGLASLVCAVAIALDGGIAEFRSNTDRSFGLLILIGAGVYCARVARVRDST